MKENNPVLNTISQNRGEAGIFGRCKKLSDTGTDLPCGRTSSETMQICSILSFISLNRFAWAIMLLQGKELDGKSEVGYKEGFLCPRVEQGWGVPESSCISSG